MEGRKKRFWIVSQLFHPNETSTAFVMTKIAEQMLNIGEVNVICGAESYQSETLSSANALDQRIMIYRVRDPAWNKNNLVLRSLSFLVLTFGIASKIFFKVKRGDDVILVTNPPTLIIVAALLKKFKKIKLTVILQDIFPENLAVTGLIKRKSRFYKLILYIFNKCYNTADHLIACGSDMKDIFIEKVKPSIPISVITNWADHLDIFPKEIDPVSYFGNLVRNKVIIEFAGNIGRVQGLDKFVEIFAKVNNPELFLVIIGDGAFKDKLEKIKEAHNLQSILFLPSKPRSEQNDFLNACDIGLVTLSEGMYGLGVPSKVYNILAAEKPILYIGDYNSEIFRYVNEYQIGWAFSWSQVDKLTEFLKTINIGQTANFKQMGKNSRRIVEKKFTKEHILNQYQKVFQDE